ncbi:MAG: type II toxin-antitoxin system VapC family toxin [Egibacteraceae bacterium]
MSAAYFDASGLVKLLVVEDGSQLADDVWDRADLAVSSRLAVPEVRAALAAARRGRQVSPAQERAASETWRAYDEALRYLPLTATIAARAGDLASRHALSCADAVHLATALVLAPINVLVVTWDRRLHLAALAEGLAVAPAGLDAD